MIKHVNRVYVNCKAKKQHLSMICLDIFYYFFLNLSINEGQVETDS